MIKHYYILLLLLCTQAILAQTYGCTDPLSNNYNPNATINDGSCTYPNTSISPDATVTLPPEIIETSGLIKWGDNLYTHNDNGDTKLYALDSLSGAVLQTLTVTGTNNQDWEDISQDSTHVYIGDFGNNVSGNRTNLSIIRADKAGLLSSNPVIETINFSYAKQTNFTSTANNATDFDCEAFVVTNDSIYLFTKQWVSKKTSVYVLPKTPGTHVALLKTTYNVGGLITGATYLEDKKTLVLCGYSTLLKPFLYLLYDFNGHEFFSGNKRKIGFSQNFHQVEGIAASTGNNYYLTNEHFVQSPFINTAQKLHRVNLSAFLDNYLENMPLFTAQNNIRDKIRVYPNPAGDIIYIEIDPSLIGLKYTFFDMTGKDVLNGSLPKIVNKINVSKLTAGLYSIMLDNYPDYSYRLVKK
ncbi:T9SS type A sorting domain-containing protein [Flavobacterium zepuense]|uniref:T9SS type A sorting domain-containing protein n=1 Tax=Flavobacterium zepuense TaxID=2593302 RepID=A0A552UXV0_9FLAO|nr:T9SS type A sorting domain-containing protein [Flavobacterium zepuense]TRW22990.1 T9SS type A sorting domain-containing protein [Flavobacterium zepuense]